MTDGPLPLLVEDLAAGYAAGDPVIEVARLSVASGEMTALVGPNAAGKTTFLKAILGIAPFVRARRVEFFGASFAASRLRVACVPQRSEIDWNFPATALQVALMGTYGRLGLLRRPRRAERARAAEALDAAGLGDHASTQISELSGGQQQRVLLARALAQDAGLLLLDEPFANVDAASEERIARTLAEECARGRAVLAVHHDLASVRAHFDRAVLLSRTVVAEGTPESALTARNLAAAYGWSPQEDAS